MPSGPSRTSWTSRTEINGSTANGGSRVRADRPSARTRSTVPRGPVAELHENASADGWDAHPFVCV